MKRVSVLVVDKKHALFFGVEGKGDGGLSSRTRLVQRESVSNVALQRYLESTKNDSRVSRHNLSLPGTSAGGHAMEGGGSHLGPSVRSGFTDAEEEEQTLVTFSKEIRKKAIPFLAAQKASELIVVAGAQMLGLLRELVISHLPPGVHVTEVRKDLTGHSTPDIHEALLREVLPPGLRPGMRPGFRPGHRMPLEQTGSEELIK